MSVRRTWRRYRGAIAAASVLLAGTAHAQLFADTEARKAIAELREVYDRQQADDRARAEAADAQNTQLAEQLKQLRQAIAELGAELGRARDEAAALRERRAALAAQLPGIGRLGAGLDDALAARLQRLEPRSVTLDGQAFATHAAETQRFDEALALLRASNYEGAVAALAKFLRRFPASGYADAAQFWLGNALYASRNYAEALTALRDFISHAPAHPRVPAAWLALANAHIEMKNTAAARKALDELVKTYPDSEAAAAAKERLASLR